MFWGPRAPPPDGLSRRPRNSPPSRLPFRKRPHHDLPPLSNHSATSYNQGRACLVAAVGVVAGGGVVVRASASRFFLRPSRCFPPSYLPKPGPPPPSLPTLLHHPAAGGAGTGAGAPGRSRGGRKDGAAQWPKLLPCGTGRLPPGNGGEYDTLLTVVGQVRSLPQQVQKKITYINKLARGERRKASRNTVLVWLWLSSHRVMTLVRRTASSRRRPRNCLSSAGSSMSSLGHRA